MGRNMRRELLEGSDGIVSVLSRPCLAQPHCEIPMIPGVGLATRETLESSKLQDARRRRGVLMCWL